MARHGAGAPAPLARAHREPLAPARGERPCLEPLFDRVFHRALLDLRLLRSTLDRQHYFAAGLPWFGTLFGRDAAIAALQTLPYGPNMAAQTLRLLARYQAAERDEFRDAAPGKILHELRSGELAHLDAIPQSPAYYGTVDATMLFVILACEYVRWSGDLPLARELRPHLDSALAWIDGPADAAGDGYLDYTGRYESGLVNQGWKDSGNAIVDADGRLADPPIALCEVQAYAYRAWRQCAELSYLGEDGDVIALDASRQDTAFTFPSYTVERLDPGQEMRHTLDVPFPAAAFDGGLEELRLAVDYLPMPYREETATVEVSAGARS